MKSSHTPPRKASWTFEILPYEDLEIHLVEDAPYDEDTRAIYQLKQPIRTWLAEHEHKLAIDRGDFGEGAEHFIVTLYTKNDADAFKALCKSLK